MENRLIDIFLQLAKIEGLSQKEKDVADYIKKFLEDLGLKPAFDDSSKASQSNTNNIICKIGNGGDFVLQSHMDTARSTSGLNPVITTTKITSDGSTVLGVDNRAGVAILLYLAEKITKEKIPVKDFTLAFTTCEETSLDGSKNIGLNGNTKYGFIFDSFLDPGKFVSSGLGAVSFKIEVFGKAAHSGIAPEEGVNVMSITVDALKKLEAGRVDEETTINFGIINGGSAVNVVPDYLFLEGEIRSKNSESVTHHKNKIADIFNRSADEKGGRIKISFNWDFKPYYIEKTDEVYKRIEEAIIKVDLIPESEISWGGSDANSLNARGIKSVNIGIGAKNPHSNKEFILIEDLNKSFEIALALVEK